MKLVIFLKDRYFKSILQLKLLARQICQTNNVSLNPLSANPTKWSNTLKQFVGKLPTNCLSVLEHFVKLALKGSRGSSTNAYVVIQILLLMVVFRFQTVISAIFDSKEIVLFKYQS